MNFCKLAQTEKICGDVFDNKQQLVFYLMGCMQHRYKRSGWCMVIKVISNKQSNSLVNIICNLIFLQINQRIFLNIFHIIIISKHRILYLDYVRLKVKLLFFINAMEGNEYASHSKSQLTHTSVISASYNNRKEWILSFSCLW